MDERREPPAQVRNAADHKQVKRAARVEERREEERRAYYFEVMSSADGRAMIWDLLTRAGIYATAFHPSGSQIYYNAGRHDFGLELLATVEPFEELYLAMEREARARKRQQDAETRAGHINTETEG
jgi:hypothetical protein